MPTDQPQGDIRLTGANEAAFIRMCDELATDVSPESISAAIQQVEAFMIRRINALLRIAEQSGNVILRSTAEISRNERDLITKALQDETAFLDHQVLMQQAISFDELRAPRSPQRASLLMMYITRSYFKTLQLRQEELQAHGSTIKEK